MKKSLGLLLTLWFVQNASAQTISYNFRVNDPNEVRNLSFSPYSYGFDFGKKATPVGFTLFYTGHHVSLESSYMFNGAAKDTTPPMAKINPYHELDLMMSLQFSDKVVDIPQRITVSSSSDGTYRYTQFFDADVNARKIKGMRLGLETFNSYLSTTTQSAAGGNYTTEYVNYTSSVFCIGYLSKRIFNYIIDYGRVRTMKRMREFYIDIMFPISSSRDNTVFPEVANTSDNHPVYHSWGGRIGWMHHSARIVGSYLRIEAGSMPGWQESSSSGSYYTKLILGFCFSTGALKKVQL